MMKPEVNAGTERSKWTRPTLTYVGHVGDVLKGGGGKLSQSPADPGESRKPKPTN